MDASALEYERVMEKKKQLLIKIQETKTGIRNKQNQRRDCKKSRIRKGKNP